MTNSGQTKGIIIELLGSQLRVCEQDANFIGDNDLRFPAVIWALIDLEQKSNLFLFQETLSRVPQELHEYLKLWPRDAGVK